MRPLPCFSVLVLFVGAPCTVCCGGRGAGADAATVDASGDAAEPSSDAPLTGDAGAPDGAAALEGGATAPLTKPDGHTPSAFGCNHHYVETASGPATPRTIAVTVHSTHGDHPAESGSITPIDPRLGTPLADAGVPISAMGAATLVLTPGLHAAFMSTGSNATFCDPCVDTYAFSQWVPPGDAALSATNVEIDAYFGLQSFGGAASPPAVVGTVRDCDGDPVTNATVRVAGFVPCDSTAASPPADCVEYTGAGFLSPDRSRTATGGDGRFLLYSRATGTMSIEAWGLLAATDDATSEVGTLVVVVVDRSLAFGDTRPLTR